MVRLRKQQIKRQDFVDNRIFELIQNLNPYPSGKEIKWNIEMIGAVRDVIKRHLVDDLRLSDEKEFYP